MTELMPFNVAQAEDLESRLASTMFRSTSDFITFYNSGLVNKTNEEVMSLADEIADSFKNVKLQGKTFVFVSKTEVELTEILQRLQVWEFGLKLSEKVKNLVSEDFLDENEELTLSLSSSVEMSVVRNHEIVVLDEKAFKSSDWNFVEQLKDISDVTVNNDTASFTARDLMTLSPDFVTEVHRKVVS